MEITIIIPTYHRPDRIQRALKYWQQYPVQVIVLDGSPERSLLDAALVACPNVAYHHMPVSFEARLLAAARLVTTPYAMFLSDDEFLIYPALVEAADVLTSDQGVAAVLGSTVMFSVASGQMVGAPCYTSAHQLQIDSDSPIGRLEQRVRFPGNVIFYSLTRAHILQIACQFIADRTYSCQYISEYQMEAVLCAAGTVKVIKRLMWLRSLETSPVSFKGWRRSVLFKEWCEERKNSADVAYLEKVADKFLSLASTHKQNISGSAFIELFTKFEYAANAANRTLANSLKARMRQIFELFPATWRHALRAFRAAVLARSEKPAFLGIDEVLIQLKLLEIRADHADLMRIKRLVEEIKD